ncbi:MAG TPA: DNA-processing protein DprA [Geopsychrobacteraceae bacterium]|nr:DNA-processing protein DprA [Geopsychrobacteraceae bacterium]
MVQNNLELLRFHLTPGVGRISLFKIRESFGSFAAALDASPTHLQQQAHLSTSTIDAIRNFDIGLLRQTRRLLEDLDVKIVSFWDDVYPAQLKQIHDPPAILYVRGTLPEQDAFAIVGSRKATPGGLQLTRELAAELASRGITIVSGLARGIDTAAHLGALDGNGSTVAVLGCGIDRVYPAENLKLFHRILEQNAIITEYAPGTPPLAGHFPGRNRIISGLSRGVLVVEAAEGSGSLITSDFALEQGRDVFAVPGAVKSNTSSGPNRLIKEGAQVVTDANDILQFLWPKLPSAKQQASDSAFIKQLDRKQRKIYHQLDAEPRHIDEIGRKCDLTPMDVSAILLDLELLGRVQALPGRYYIRGQLP